MTRTVFVSLDMGFLRFFFRFMRASLARLSTLSKAFGLFYRSTHAIDSARVGRSHRVMPASPRAFVVEQIPMTLDGGKISRFERDAAAFALPFFASAGEIDRVTAMDLEAITADPCNACAAKFFGDACNGD
jgi:hypothetical protein